MVYVRLLVGAPCFIASLKRMLGTDDLSFEERGQSGVVFCKACIDETSSESANIELSQRFTAMKTHLECANSHTCRTRPCPRA